MELNIEIDNKGYTINLSEKGKIVKTTWNSNKREAISAAQKLYDYYSYSNSVKIGENLQGFIRM